MLPLIVNSLFGTDGIRGLAGQPPITAEMAVRVGRAVTTFFSDDGTHPRVGDMLTHALAAGVCAQGGEACLLGVLPTPALARLTVDRQAAAGVMISASHNPYRDNGIKVFDGRGHKLDDDREAGIEKLILAGKNGRKDPAPPEHGPVTAHADAADAYMAFLKEGRLHAKTRLSGLNVILDCGHGATYEVAPRFFESLGMRVEALHVAPDGRNINAGCGSQHPETMADAVRAGGADAGLAFDGDGDRVIAVDETGRVLGGDVILAICARHLKKLGRLTADTAVSTVMSNVGLGLSLKKAGIRHLVTDVGDRHVMQKMIETGAIVGGEDSGHMIFRDHHSTGDGIFTGLRLLEIMSREGRKLSQLADIIHIYPQQLINVDVSSKPAIESVPEILAAVRAAEAELGDRGRVLVRYSGTQSCCRVMVEGPTEDKTRALCRRIADVIRDELG